LEELVERPAEEPVVEEVEVLLVEAVGDVPEPQPARRKRSAMRKLAMKAFMVRRMKFSVPQRAERGWLVVGRG
jgi:hypothetical protein